jgi:hypothetical protein
MTRIIVKNGNWDQARAELGASMAAKRKSFDAQLEAAFAPRKPAADEAPRAAAAPQPASTPSGSKLVLSRSPRR